MILCNYVHMYITHTMLFSTVQSLWHIVGSIIHLGNLEYEGGFDGHARFKNPELIKTIAKVSPINVSNITPVMFSLLDLVWVRCMYMYVHA